jgi:RNA polymerase sigma-70 factor (ECF subfamily)
MNCMDRDSELQLVDRLRRCEAGAFEAVHDAFNARLFNFLARLANSRDVAEDLLEETWLRFVRHADRLQPDTQLAAWLFTVARNLHVSYCRSRAIEIDAAAGLDLWPQPGADTPFELLARTEFEGQVEAAVAELPVTLREALLLVAMEGMRPSEAAVVCGTTPEAMRQRLRRARVLVADRLGLAAEEPRVQAGA